MKLDTHLYFIFSGFTLCLFCNYGVVKATFLFSFLASCIISTKMLQVEVEQEVEDPELKNTRKEKTN